MKRLGHSIMYAVDSGAWTPFRFARQGTPLSHLFFVDDLILYAHANLDNTATINSVLIEFGLYSGHRVSKRMTHLYFSSNTPLDLQNSINSLMGYKIVNSIDKYLGVPVIHQRVQCLDFDFILDEMRTRLSGWVVQTLSLLGRITLAKSILEAIPAYFMQTAILSKKDPLPSSIRRTSCFSLWRSLANMWDEFIPNMAWSLGDGSLIDVWDDIWIPKVGPLRSHALDPSSPALYPHFSDLMTADGSWNTPLSTAHYLVPLRHYFDLGGIHIPPHGTTSGVLVFLREFDSLTRNRLYMSFETVAPLDETPPYRLAPTLLTPRGTSSSYIWKSRNSLVFTGTPQYHEFVVQHGIVWARHYDSSPVAQPSLTTTNDPPAYTKWSPLPPRWICLNVDGAVCSNRCRAAIGGVFRDISGSWICCFDRYIGTSDALQAELWAIYDGPKLAWHQGFEFVQVQSDCLRATSIINAADASDSPMALVRSISALMKRAWVVDLVWIRREANHAADLTAKHALLNLQFDLVVHDSPLNSVRVLLHRDVEGPPYYKTSAS
ncbi:hypothetical protein F3Y22_tig00111064pilonHSYRG00028 [Hibiscus syriacus]|uniref:RNase H type-1 domain-containing protein n=1 Tax=Hibiscus syriacus TaxID=106335 RepID=A0A6A2Z3V8_HIBSY|nr:hypothetical protein F3Y22_tig00111064pilonHSYRG00028 [Hibiscus syriacus]